MSAQDVQVLKPSLLWSKVVLEIVGSNANKDTRLFCTAWFFPTRGMVDRGEARWLLEWEVDGVSISCVVYTTVHAYMYNNYQYTYSILTYSNTQDVYTQTWIH